MTLTAPFPWHGGKRRVAPVVWERLGNPTVYVEPFMGSGAVLLARPGGAGPREIVCDTDGGLCNFWRAIRFGDPEEVAWWADYPTIHQDLTARHRWLREWIADNSERLETDPEFFNVQAAGWWVWGISLWIGGGWCVVDHDKRPAMDDKTTTGRGVSAQRDIGNQRPSVDPRGGGRGVSAQRVPQRDSAQVPHVKSTGGAQGVSAQREGMPPPPDRRPHVKSHNTSGTGVAAQRKFDKDTHEDRRPRVTLGGAGIGAQRRTWDEANVPSDKMPHINTGQGTGGGRGVNAKRRTWDKVPSVMMKPGGRGVQAQRRARPELVAWFEALCERLKAVVVLNRSWESALTPTLLQQTPSGPKSSVGVFLDPPYLTEARHQNIYASDFDGSSDSVAGTAYEWAVEYGDKYRVAYCCHEGDFPLPDGWTALTQSFGGIRREERRDRQDMIMFSPACLPDSQMSLFE